ncbi:MAG TPA: pirin family protein [Fimbriimonadaceae bacterium]|nr:pirin family protein [Fimbriimonadaceae bacterium]
MTTIRRSEERGQVDFGWLKSYHTFSFGDYRDENWVHYRSLRVINTDFVAPGAGFPTHPHRDMEIVTYMLDGALAHRDSMENGSTIRPGDVQRMTAGSGITHSEFNPSETEPASLLQIWLFPTKKGLTPSYEQTTFDPAELQNALRVVASPDGREGSVSIHQNALILASKLEVGRSVTHTHDATRGLWLHVIEGEVTANSTTLQPGDAAAFEEVGTLNIEASKDAHFLLFDLA